MRKVFISYSHDGKTDTRLAEFLHAAIMGCGLIPSRVAAFESSPGYSQMPLRRQEGPHFKKLVKSERTVTC